MSCMLSCSNGVVIATAMVVSSTALFLAISRQFSGNQTTQGQGPRPILRSSLSSEEKKRERKKQKKRVRFAENVKETKGNGEEYRREHSRRTELLGKPEETGSVCRIEMPANRIALYNGILRDRNQRIQCSY
ncbi:PREDICTED: uncharacterized protein LOC104815531 [Tarenaya hassleriana]|uniref:uncharacterized protein LOC104815531 n=1 Tax=Tarenaya hassleriana TaxID=28532 RepID=UPI00053C676A|nr:PREDICTED: uncharacterized protein LOC104815531 [Tarenaya hassleriana]